MVKTTMGVLKDVGYLTTTTRGNVVGGFPSIKMYSVIMYVGMVIVILLRVVPLARANMNVNHLR